MFVFDYICSIRSFFHDQFMEDARDIKTSCCDYNPFRNILFTNLNHCICPKTGGRKVPRGFRY